MRIVLIDNYDSFTYNVVQRLGEIDPSLDILVFRNDEISVEDIAAQRADRLIISPGPGNPDEAGISIAAIKAYYDKMPVLGICLGHQSIGQCFGATIIQASNIMHGKTSRIDHDGKGVFANLPKDFVATRYHSLIIDESTLPDCLEVSARSDDGTGEIMGVRHKTQPLHGVQFHPESFLTDSGYRLLDNFLKL